MFKPTLQLILAAGLLFGTTACKTKKKPALKPGQLTVEQKAELKKKAYENYKKLVEKYPDSPYKDRAEERVRALTPPAKK